MAKFAKLWDEVKYLFKTVNGGKPREYKKDFMKIRFHFDIIFHLSLGKILKLHDLTVVIRSVFEEDGKYYPQIFLDEYLYAL